MINLIKKYDVSKFSMASVHYYDAGCIHLLLDTHKGKYDVSNKRWLNSCAIIYEKPLTDYVPISEDKISLNKARKYATDEVFNALHKDVTAYLSTKEGSAKYNKLVDAIHLDEVISEVSEI